MLIIFDGRIIPRAVFPCFIVNTARGTLLYSDAETLDLQQREQIQQRMLISRTELRKSHG